MVSITNGYDRICKDSLGGVKTVWLFPWAKYSRKNVQREGINLVKFPSNNIYKFDGLFDSSFTENDTFDANGQRFDQTLTINFSKINADYYFKDLRDGLLRAIVKDNNGNLWMLGQDNGIRAKQYTKQTGSDKSQLNGYNLTFEGSERMEAPFLSSLDVLTGTGAKFDSTLITWDSTLITFDSL
jgi:hypothetical protein